MLNGLRRTAEVSSCGRYRSTLTRTWDERPRLLAIMFNPSWADAGRDDQTVTLLCHIASHNGFGGIVVANGISLISSNPAEAYAEVASGDAEKSAALLANLETIREAVVEAGSVLLAWGALASKTIPSRQWFERVEEVVRASLPTGGRLLCLGRTASGAPLHPMARGKLKVPKDALLLPWA